MKFWKPFPRFPLADRDRRRPDPVSKFTLRQAIKLTKIPYFPPHSLGKIIRRKAHPLTAYCYFLSHLHRDTLVTKGGDNMSNVIKFPNSGEKVALYTESKMYAGVCAESQDFLGRPGIWITDAVVCPISGQARQEEVLRLGSVCVLWDKVVAVSYSPELAPSE